jgi:hypothetical protein
MVSRFFGLARRFFAKAELSAEGFDRGTPTRSSESAIQSADQALGILRRAKKMCGLHERAKFVGRDEGDVFTTTAMNEHGLASICSLVHEALQIRSGVRIRGFGGDGGFPASQVQ